MATAIKIYSVDSNENAITKTVSNANPDASDYVLKNFSQQLMTLSNNAFSRAERVDTKDITSATEGGDTSVSGFPVVSSSPFFSTDSSTYVAAFNSLTAATGNIIVRAKSEGSSMETEVSLYNAKNAGSLTGFVHLINYSGYNTIAGNQKLTAEQITNGVKLYPSDIDTGSAVYKVNEVWLMEDENSRNENVAAWLKSVGENLINVAGYTVTYGELWGSGSMKGIKIIKNS